MFRAASLDITVPLPPLRHVNVFEDLPLALCERPQHADPDWLLQQPFHTYHVAPATAAAAAASSSSIESIVATSSSAGQQTDSNLQEEATATVTAAVDTEAVPQSVVPVSDADAADALAVDPPLTRPQVVVNWGNEPIRLLSEHLATKDFDAFVRRIAQVIEPPCH